MQGTVLGHFSPVIEEAIALEASIGHPFNMVRLNTGLEKTGRLGYIEDEYDRLAALGLVPRLYINIGVDPSKGMTFGTVRRGAQNEQLRERYSYAATCRPWRSVEASFHHEQAVNNADHQEGGGRPEDYPDAFRQARSAVMAEGLHVTQGGPVRMVFCPEADQYLSYEEASRRIRPWLVEIIDPGPESVDLYAADGYRKIDNAERRPDASFLDLVSEYARARGKRYMIGEIGCCEGEWKPAWVTDAFQRIRDHGGGVGGCHAVCWTNKEDAEGGDMRPASSPEALEAFVYMAHHRRWFSQV